MQGAREVDQQCCYCRRLLCDIVSKNSPYGFRCTEVAAVPIFFDLIDRLFITISVTIQVYMKFCRIWTYEYIVEFTKFWVNNWWYLYGYI